ncbi:uncharacterized protein LOC131620124 [Vicia villosa]|uniref:uncharacterized protein LOC131620124 n=1 Tax=Vicia villosa TaxID=3911 RepID=UPI00273C0648|nr:uncharacterized protein LOC131620124 [Vicia villosa]
MESGLEEGQPEIKEALKILWNSWMPSKVKIFGWRLLKERLAAKYQLIKRHIIEDNDMSLCVFGCGQREDSKHLFLNCQFLRMVWVIIMAWIGIEPVTGTDCCNHFLQVMESLKKCCSVRRAAGLWMDTCWCVWKERNDITFNNVVGDIDEIVHSVKMHT